MLTFVTSSASSPAPAPSASEGAAGPVPPPASSSGSSANASSGSNPDANPDSNPPPDAASGGDDSSQLFSLRDRRIIRSCVNDHVADLPAGATQRPELPSGAERQMHRGGTLSSDIQNQAQALPLACEDQLPKLPGDLERVLYGGRVLLIDGKGHILDTFFLDQNQ